MKAEDENLQIFEMFSFLISKKNGKFQTIEITKNKNWIGLLEIFYR